jgi:hypothetical protein
MADQEVFPISPTFSKIAHGILPMRAAPSRINLAAMNQQIQHKAEASEHRESNCRPDQRTAWIGRRRGAAVVGHGYSRAIFVAEEMGPPGSTSRAETDRESRSRRLLWPNSNQT